MKMRMIASMMLFLVLSGCKDSYDLPLDVPATGYLVVEGVINSGVGNTTISLSKSVKLIDSFNVNYVKEASVVVEGENGSVNQLYYTGEDGDFGNYPLFLDPGSRYRLRINLPDGKVYLSEFLSINRSPAIDDVTWERDGDGVQIYANAHGSSGNSGFYRWEYDETWEYHSAYIPNLKLNSIPMAVFIYPDGSSDPSKFTCYSNGRSTRIDILSTARLSVDTTHYPLIRILNAGRKLSVLYSCNVQQYEISKECFEYLTKMKRNTEQSGSLFDAQPSELRGNITCVSNPQEPVIGFIQVADIYSKRIFINNSEVPGWGYIQGCEQFSVFNHKDSIPLGMAPTVPESPDVRPGNEIERFMMAEPSCVDCTIRGGTTTKPSFWP